jgi:hypothetical protein
VAEDVEILGDYKGYLFRRVLCSDISGAQRLAFDSWWWLSTPQASANLHMQIARRSPPRLPSLGRHDKDLPVGA